MHPPERDGARRLAELPPGRNARVLALDAVRELRPMLMELGVYPGVVVRVVRRAPFGCPLEVDVGGSRFSLRRETAVHVLVELLD